MAAIKVRFVRQFQAITGDTYRVYEATNGRRAEIRTRLGGWAARMPRTAKTRPWSNAQAKAEAVRILARRR